MRLLDDDHGTVEGEEVEAETYVWIAGEKRLEDQEWDFEVFVKEKMARWTGETGEKEGEYDDVDAAVAGSEEVDGTGGRSLDGGIGRALREEQERGMKNGEVRDPIRSAV